MSSVIVMVNCGIVIGVSRFVASAFLLQVNVSTIILSSYNDVNFFIYVQKFHVCIKKNDKRYEFFSVTFKTLRHRVTGGFKSHRAQSVNGMQQNCTLSLKNIHAHLL
jgi:hypothetical protein